MKPTTQQPTKSLTDYICERATTSNVVIGNDGQPNATATAHHLITSVGEIANYTQITNYTHLLRAMALYAATTTTQNAKELADQIAQLIDREMWLQCVNEGLIILRDACEDMDNDQVTAKRTEIEFND